MGNYEPAQPGKQRSLNDTLLEAEEDHLLDCPDADFVVRAAALLLDLILFSLASSGIHHLFTAVDSYAAHALSLGNSEASQALAGRVATTIVYLTYLTKVAAGYLFFLWSVTQFGGSPGKLLLGLRVLSVRTGRRLGPSRVLVREAVKATAGLVAFWLALVRRDHRGVHDLVSGSVVKKVHGAP